jgi:hypothetical protein
MHAPGAIAIALILAGCADLEVPRGGAEAEADAKSKTLALTAATRLERVTAIRDVSAGMGVSNAVLLAGVAESETNMAHCWSEATWACQGPDSPSCGGGPVIAGAADGPCSLRQGGLGMFQFDAGTYEQTLARDGEDILLLEGNIAKGVEFVLSRITEEIPGAGEWEAALAWINSVPIEAGAPLMEQWASMIVCRYNGCCSGAAVCLERRRKYRDNAIQIYSEYGPEFWGAAGRCDPVPPEGRILDERDGCYVAGGDPKFWRREARGYGGDLEWTMTTDLEREANYAIWRFDIAEAGRYEVQVHLDAGEFGKSRQARYLVQHAGSSDEILIDQSDESGFASLGEFDFSAGGDQHLLLGDNTGEPSGEQISLLYDAVQIVPAGASDDVDGHLFGGCTAAGSSGAPLGPLSPLAPFAPVALALLFARRGRRVPAVNYPG